jgi:hypothetical protein
MRRTVLAAIVLWPAVALAAPPGQDPDWPCQQRLVPEVSAGTYWPGTLPEPGSSLPDSVAKLVGETASRSIPVEEATAHIAGFLHGLGPAARKALAPQAFIAIVAAANEERAQVIESLKDLMRRQRDVAALVSKANGELAAIPADAEGEAAAKRAEIAQRRDFLARTFEATRKTIRYACEAPGQIDQRLGAFAKQLQAGMGG